MGVYFFCGVSSIFEIPMTTSKNVQQSSPWRFTDGDSILLWISSVYALYGVPFSSSAIFAMRSPMGSFCQLLEMAFFVIWLNFCFPMKVVDCGSISRA